MSREKSSTFVKVGAHDGVTGDPCGDIFLHNKNWRGILVEPVPGNLEKLAETYGESRFTIVADAIGAEDSTAEFYHISSRAKEDMPDLASWYDQIGSLDKEHIRKHLGAEIEPYIVAQSVRIRTLDSLLRDLGIEAVDILHIDAEGFDLVILQSLDFKRHRPRIVLAENKHLGSEGRAQMRELLRRNRYRVINTGGDFLAIA